MIPKSDRTTRVLATASSGGHWVQLMRLRQAWHDLDVAYLTTEQSYAEQVVSDALENGFDQPRFYVVVAANQWQKLRLIKQLIQIAIVVIKERPDVVCSTGAAPGYFAVRLGKLLGARTIWVDSIANAETLSLAGEKVAGHADAWLTQWEDLAETEEQSGRRPQYWGAVL